MFDKINNKYNINEEDNVPEFVYGTPDFMLDNNQNNEEKYNINPEQNIPQEVYGVTTSEKYVLPKSDLRTIKINIKNNESNYVLMLSYVADNKIDLIFGDLNKLENKTLDDITINITKTEFNAFLEKYNAITLDWKESYIGEKNINWSITENLDKDKYIFGNGGFPNNWNEFIDLLVEYEIIFKNNK